ncbi:MULTISPECIES: DHHA1 domain-containing protein [Methanosarcina]|uniref:Protein F12M16.25 n=1 Tax=Methanosarcina vacuolata Z-761 TaxID=1434123 RepID=A0A0E3Q5X9_9EURY|nr:MULTISPECIES: DHH family phosphoesterase [Methanosarcina]AKB44109.1 protein F12M16.25 [Methanosarcina vacuolata Z-761]AKB47591.1 protein F12M16.25 [Methanosarcina sp. Kolksee]
MIVIYHHDDLDGQCSAAQAREATEKTTYNPIKCIAVQYSGNTWKKEEIEEANEVYVLDFTFPDMETLVEIAGKKLIWIDHHKTTMEEHKELWNSNILGKRDITKAASQLTWEYFKNDQPLPTAVEYISRRDIWQFGDKKEEISAFTEACQILIHSPEDEDWKDLLASSNNGKEKVELYLIIGRALADVQKVRIEKAFERGTDINFHGLRARLINTTSDASDIGEYVYQKPEYDIAVMWQIVNDMVQVSLRSNSTDCAEIAQKYGGGGHRGAAGFRVKSGGEFSLRLFATDVASSIR